MQSEVSPHLSPPKGKGSEEKTRRRKGVISLAQVGGWGIASQPKYPFHNANTFVHMKASYLGQDPVKYVTDRNNIVICYICIREHFYLSILGVCMNIEKDFFAAFVIFK